MSNREEYIEFAKTQSHLPLYFRPIWLDAVSDSWDAVLAKDGGQIIGAMPYHFSVSHSIRRIQGFQHTKYNGFYVAQPEEAKPYRRYSLNKKALTLLSEQLHNLPVDYIEIAAPPMLTDCSPLHAQGFTIETMYTFRIPWRESFNNTWAAMHSRVRNKSKNKAGLIIKEDAYGPDALQRQIEGSFQKQGLHTGLTVDFLNRIYCALKQEDRASILTAEDSSGTIHGAICFVWDNDTLYYEFGGENPALRSSNSLTLLMLDGIRIAHEKKLIFDFDIGMNKGFQDFAASFGAVAVPYYRLRKVTATNELKWFYLSTSPILRSRVKSTRACKFVDMNRKITPPP